jgi:hypothetical protein
MNSRFGPSAFCHRQGHCGLVLRPALFFHSFLCPAHFSFMSLSARRILLLLASHFQWMVRTMSMSCSCCGHCHPASAASLCAQPDGRGAPSIVGDHCESDGIRPCNPAQFEGVLAESACDMNLSLGPPSTSPSWPSSSSKWCLCTLSPRVATSISDFETLRNAVVIGIMSASSF